MTSIFQIKNDFPFQSMEMISLFNLKTGSGINCLFAMTFQQPYIKIDTLYCKVPAQLFCNATP